MPSIGQSQYKLFICQHRVTQNACASFHFEKVSFFVCEPIFLQFICTFWGHCSTQTRNCINFIQIYENYLEDFKVSTMPECIIYF